MAAILREVKDPRVSEAFVSITGAEVTPDLKYAKIYYSAMRGDKKEVARGLKSSTGFMRRMVAQKMNLRITPELQFIRDQSLAYGAHISTLLNQITYAPETGEEAGEESAATEKEETE